MSDTTSDSKRLLAMQGTTAALQAGWTNTCSLSACWKLVLHDELMFQELHMGGA